MSSSNASDQISIELAKAVAERIDEVYLLVGQVLASEGESASVPESSVQKLFAVAVKLFTRKCEEEDHVFAPFEEEHAVTATDVVSTIPEMLRAADLNAFDLALWLQRPRR